jgi:hypothetical protein
MVEMRDRQAPLLRCREAMQNVQEHHRIQAPGDSDQDALTSRKQLPARQLCFVGQISHTGTLYRRNGMSQDAYYFSLDL